MKVKALDAMPYAGKRHKKNAVFSMKDKHAKLFIKLGKVVEHVPEPEPEPEPEPKPKRAPRRRTQTGSTGTYNRRDMTAEE